jgi:hypothetical protein
VLLGLELGHFQEVPEHVEPMTPCQFPKAAYCFGNKIRRFLGPPFARELLDP